MMGERGEKRIWNLNERKKEEVCRSKKGKSEGRKRKMEMNVGGEEKMGVGEGKLI